MYEIVFDTEYGGLYDRDKETGQVTKVLQCYGKCDACSYVRFPYNDHGQFVVATSKQIKQWGNKYLDENGNKL